MCRKCTATLRIKHSCNLDTAITHRGLENEAFRSTPIVCHLVVSCTLASHSHESSIRRVPQSYCSLPAASLATPLAGGQITVHESPTTKEPITSELEAAPPVGSDNGLRPGEEYFPYLACWFLLATDTFQRHQKPICSVLGSRPETYSSAP